MSISIVVDHPTVRQSPFLRRLERQVRATLDNCGQLPTGRSASGVSLSFAVAWCEEHGVPYTIRARLPYGGYDFEVHYDV